MPGDSQDPIAREQLGKTTLAEMPKHPRLRRELHISRANCSARKVSGLAIPDSIPYVCRSMGKRCVIYEEERMED